MRRVLLALALTVASLPAHADDVCARKISVTGRAQSNPPPDFAAVTVGVEAKAPDAAKALDATSRAAEGILKIAQELGVPQEDLGTAAITLNEAWKQIVNPDQTVTQEPDGYRAENKVTIRLGDMARLGDLLRRILSVGANRIEAIGFGLRDPDRVEAQLEAAAARDARQRAQALADAVGVRLGPLCSLSTMRTARGDQVQAFRFSGGSSDKGLSAPRVPVAAGSLDQRAEAAAVFAVAP